MASLLLASQSSTSPKGKAGAYKVFSAQLPPHPPPKKMHPCTPVMHPRAFGKTRRVHRILAGGVVARICPHFLTIPFPLKLNVVIQRRTETSQSGRDRPDILDVFHISGIRSDIESNIRLDKRIPGYSGKSGYYNKELNAIGRKSY